MLKNENVEPSRIKDDTQDGDSGNELSRNVQMSAFHSDWNRM